jgi:hypothetical protein
LKIRGFKHEICPDVFVADVDNGSACKQWFCRHTICWYSRVAEGSAYAIRAGSTVKLNIGDPIFEGDLIKTGRRSSIFASMSGDKENSIKMGQRSQLEVEKFTVSTTGEVLGGFLRGLVGIFTVELNKLRKGRDFSMKTPTAVLGVRGTVWSSIVKSDGSTTFAVKRGAISIKMGGKTVLLKKGQTVSVTKSGKVSAVTPTPKSLQDSLDSDGSTFDNAAAEAAALAAAEKEAKEAAEALAEAELAMVDATEGELTAAVEALKDAEALVAAAEQAAKNAAIALIAAEAGVAQVSVPAVSDPTLNLPSTASGSTDATGTGVTNKPTGVKAPATSGGGWAGSPS